MTEPDITQAICQDLLQRDSTPATFRDQFKRQFGMTPTEYRQNL